MKKGELALMTGAGISVGLGFPPWWKLTRELLKLFEVEAYKQIDKNTDPSVLQSLISSVESRPEFISNLHLALYQNSSDDTDKGDIHFNKTLVALGSLLNSGSNRGRIDTIINFNYDDVIERYLSLNGYSHTSITSPDSTIGTTDSIVYHPHGYIPRNYIKGIKTGQIILSRESYIARYSEPELKWNSRIQSVLMSKVGLMVGLSGDDDLITALISKVHRNINSDMRYVAFAILTPGAYTKNASRLNQFGIHCLSLDPAEIPYFLVEICQRAEEL